MASVHMTDVVVSRLKTPGIYYDTTTPAFGVRVGKHRKVWVITRGRDRQRVSVGQYPAMTLAEARKAAKKLLAEDVATRDARMTVGAAYDLFKANHIVEKRARTQYDYKRVMEKHLLPTLEKKQLADIQYEDVTSLTDKLAPAEKGHSLAVARTFFRWCVQPPRRYIKHSPLEGVRVKTGNPRKRVLKDAELKTVWEAAERQGYPHGTIVQLLILTGQRRGETSSLAWPWIDTRERTITLPETVTKNKREHTFPFGDQVAAILDTIPRRNSTDLLFPSTVSDDRPVSGFSKFKHEMTDGVPGWTLHDLRRTFGTKLAEIRILPHVVERLLNHTMGSIGNRADSVVSVIAEVYNRATYLPEMREAVAAWEARLSTILAAI